MAKPSLREQLEQAPSGQLAELYITVRNQRNAHRRLEAKAQARMDYIAIFIRRKMVKERQDAFRAAGSSVYTYTLDSTSLHDPEAFINHIKATNNYELIERRASTAGCLAYADEHTTVDKDGVVTKHFPPGVTYTQIEKLGVRKGR